ncbi:hypothetical protein JXQ70_12985 [bacterium]|nr:hypothetical protein [bacterium]
MKDIDNVPPGELRKFGIAFCVFLTLFATFFIWRHGWLVSPITGSLLGLAGIFLIMGLALPRQLQPVFKVWMILARALGWLNTKILLTLVYYLIFAPFSLIIRLCGGDLLKEKYNPDCSTFWIQRENKNPCPERYQKQF